MNYRGCNRWKAITTPILLAIAALTVTAVGHAQENRDIPGLTIRLTSDHAAGEVFVNGIPATTFGAATDTNAKLGGGIGRLTDWLQNGENEVLVRVRAINAQPPEVIVSILDADKPTRVVVGDKIVGAGDKLYKLSMQNLPAWSWTKAEPWTGDDTDLRTAVAALHQAYVDRNGPKVRALQGGFFADMTEVVGPPSSADIREFDQNVKRMTVAPLPSPLTTEPYAGGRVWRVTGPDGDGPVRLSQKVGGETIDWTEGSYWSRISGSWQMIR